MIFPAYAGLNPGCGLYIKGEHNIPRIRGVEPWILATLQASIAYSPHTRG